MGRTVAFAGERTLLEDNAAEEELERSMDEVALVGNTEGSPGILDDVCVGRRVSDTGNIRGSVADDSHWQGLMGFAAGLLPRVLDNAAAMAAVSEALDLRVAVIRGPHWGIGSFLLRRCWTFLSFTPSF